MKTTEKQYKPRIIDGMVDEYLSAFGAVCIEGPKWCGKTWTAAHHSKSEFFIGDPAGGFQNRALAQMSPALVLEGEVPRLLDEWQEAPALWDAVRYTVDERATPGQFLLTGSSTPQRKGILHSGAGRIGKLRMRTMSLFESGDSVGAVSLSALCNGELTPTITGEVDLRTLAGLIVRGGFPANLNVPAEKAALLPRAYLDAIVDDDITRLDEKRYDKTKMRLLLQSLARNESTTASKKKLIDDIRAMGEDPMDIDTLNGYLDAFERLFLLDDQPAFSQNLRSSVRIRQAAKRHFADPSLAAALLRATPERLIGDLKTFGFLFEALCERDLRIYAESFGARMFHYRDYADDEIDAVVELEDGRWCAFEIKLGANQIDKAAEHLCALRDKLASGGDTPPSVLAVISGLSNAAYVRPDGVFVVPIAALKN